MKGADRMKKKKVFVLEIVDEQKYTWQGQLSWIDGQKKQSFRSVMEMLQLIRSALDDGSDDQNKDIEEAMDDRHVGEDVGGM